MPSYGYKNDVELAFDANKKRLRAEGSILLAEAMNEALNEMTTQFNDALAKGTILHIGGTREEMKELLFSAATKKLGPGEDRQE